MKFLAVILVVGSSFLTWAQPKRILLTNGFLHVGNGETMESALVAIVDGKIISVKNSLATTVNKQEWDTIINLNGQHIYPGFVAPNSTLGLTEIDAVRATRDYDDVGEFNPHVRTQIAYNAESKVISTVKTNGVLITQATPRGGIISGTSSVMFLSGWNWEDATILKDDGIHLNWPSSTEGGGWWAEPAPKKKNEDYDAQKTKINEFFQLSSTYAKAKNPTIDLRLEAMKACFTGEKRVFFHADEIQQILDVMDFVKEFNIKYPVIVGGYDAHLIGKRFKDANIPVMLTRVHSLPEMDEDAVDLPYKLPYLLQQQGIKFCLQNTGDMETMNARNIPFLAGTAIAYGLTDEEALRAISLSSCEILGIDKKFGSIQVGKSATLFVSEGPALDMRTNKVSLILVNGKFESATNFQTDLYNKYKKKYEEKQK